MILLMKSLKLVMLYNVYYFMILEKRLKYILTLDLLKLLLVYTVLVYLPTYLPSC